MADQPAHPEVVIDGVPLLMDPVTLVLFPPNVPEYCGHPGVVPGHDSGDVIHCGWCHVGHRVTASVQTYVTR